MSSPSTEIGAVLDRAGAAVARVRQALAEGVLGAVFRAVVKRDGLRPQPGMPLHPDPALRSYWTKREPERRGRERYERPY